MSIDDVVLHRFRPSLSDALLGWAMAIESHTGRRPREVFVDLATRNALVNETISYGNPYANQDGTFEIAGIRVHVIE